MEKKNQVPKYPPLRFPEFTDEWKECKISDYGTVVTGSTPSTKDVENYEDDGFLWASPADIDGNKFIERTKTTLSSKGFDKTRKLPPLSVLAVCIGSSIGKLAMAKNEMATNQQINSIVSNPLHSPEFVYYAITSRFRSYLSAVAVQAVPIISKSTFERLPNSTTSLPEQRKIAALLGLIDERIEVQNAIIKEQEALKASLIRRLFDRTLRFPEFTDEWKVVKLGEVGEKQHAKNADDSIDRVYTNSAQDGIVEQTEFFDKEIANGNNLSGYYIVKQYDFVYNPRLSKTAPVGAMNLNKNTGIGLVSPLYTVFRITARSVLNEFLEYLFESTSWHGYMNEVANFGARSDRMNIKDKDFFNLPLRLPSLLEQRKIAALLSAVDERIAVEKEYATLLQKQKAYLLRQMFV